MYKNKKIRKVNLRKLIISDAEFISKNAKDKDITRYTFVVAPPFRLKEARRFIKKTQSDIQKKKAYEFGIELKETKELIGTINLFNIDYKNKNAEIGIWMAKKYWGKGLAWEALSLMLQFGFFNLKLERIQARVLHKNIFAKNLLKRIGFKLEGKLRKKTFFKNRWFDDLIYGILKQNFSQTHWSTLRESGERH